MTLILVGVFSPGRISAKHTNVVYQINMMTVSSVAPLWSSQSQVIPLTFHLTAKNAAVSERAQPRRHPRCAPTQTCSVVSIP